MKGKKSELGKAADFESKEPDPSGMNQLVEGAVGDLKEAEGYLNYLDKQILECVVVVRTLQPNSNGKVDFRWWHHKTWPGRHPYPFEWKVGSAVVNSQVKVVASCTQVSRKQLALRAKTNGKFEITSPEVKVMLKRIDELLILREDCLETIKVMQRQFKSLKRRILSDMMGKGRTFVADRKQIRDELHQKVRDEMMAQERRRDAALAQQRDDEGGWDRWFESQETSLPEM